MINDKLCRKRIKKAKIIGAFLACLPFVRCVILNGSLAFGVHKESSDIDILIIAKNDRVFSARFFVNVIAVVFGIKRPRDERKNHAGKFCFNYFLTEKHLKINCPKDREEYCALNYSKSLFIAGSKKLYEEFLLANKELFAKYGFEALGARSIVIPTPKPCLRAEESYRLEGTVLKRSLRFARDGKSDVWFERWIKSYQIKKIENDPITKKYPTLIVYNDTELRFHPPSHKLRRTDPPNISIQKLQGLD